jgi:hypothetical protein
VGVGGLCLGCLMEFGDLGGLSGGELLDHVDGLARTQRQTEVQILRAARAHAVLHDPDSIPGWQRQTPGGERARRFGGEGTPPVAEFSPATLGGRLAISTHAARELMADALDIAARLPRIAARVEALEVKVSYARHVARQTRELSREQADHVDQRLAESADGRVSWARLELLVQAAVKAADPQAAAAREEAERRRQFAQPTASNTEGMRGFYIRGPFAVIARLDAAVAYFAQLLAHLGDPGGEDERRVNAILILANPVHALDLRPLRGAWVTIVGRPARRGPRDWGGASAAQRQLPAGAPAAATAKPPDVAPTPPGSSAKSRGPQEGKAPVTVR